jgi:hypothetical protein
MKPALSLRSISKHNRKAFELEMPTAPKPAFPASPSWTSFPCSDYVGKPISDDQIDSLSRFVTHDPLFAFSHRATTAAFATRRQLFMRSIERLDSLFTQHKGALSQCVLDRAEEERKIGGVIMRLQKLTRRGVEAQRKNAAILILLHRTQMKIFKEQSHALKADLKMIAGFRDFVGTFSETDDTPYPLVDVVSFQRSLGESGRTAAIAALQRRSVYLRAHRKDLVERKAGTGSWEFNLLHPRGKTGMVIQRFENKIDSLHYEEVFSIIEHLSEDSREFRRIEALLFDLAWCKKTYPFGLSGKRKQAAPIQLPVKGDMFPAVIGPTVLNSELAFTPFSILNSLQWPFRSAVDKLFEMLLLTNPFDIARVYWEVIQLVAKCMQRILVIGGMDPNDIEIDFDSLFPVLMICVFAFGVDEWMRVALYTVSFSDFVSDDPELQFSMTYLEGLITHIIALDQDTLRRKAAEMRTVWADEQADPLGLS